MSSRIARRSAASLGEIVAWLLMNWSPYSIRSATQERSQSEQTTSCVSEHYRNDASAIPGTMAAWCAKSLHSEQFLPKEMSLCVMWRRHCPSIDSAPGDEP